MRLLFFKFLNRIDTEINVFVYHGLNHFVFLCVKPIYAFFEAVYLK